jgi:hypothetical protein
MFLNDLQNRFPSVAPRRFVGRRPSQGASAIKIRAAADSFRARKR